MKKTYPPLDDVKFKIINTANKYQVYPTAKMIFKDNKDIPQDNYKIIKNYGMTIFDIISMCDIKYDRYKNQKNPSYSEEELVNFYLELYNTLNRVPTSIEIDEYKKNHPHFPSYSVFHSRLGKFDKICTNLNLKSNKVGVKFTEEFLINELRRFVKEFGRVPTCKDFENLSGYPSRKTFSNHFGSFNAALRSAGLEPIKVDSNGHIKRSIEDKSKYNNREFLLSELKRYVQENNEVPKSKTFERSADYPSRTFYEKIFGSWNNALVEAGLQLNSVSQYTDEFLEQEFHRFVKENGRIPIYAEFNNSSYPSFWCYQNRFGSWNKAVRAYGYTPNDSNRKFFLDNGEVCFSSYEFDVSNWLITNNIKYIRDVNYKDFIEKYKGKMNCDYVIYKDDSIWYVEVAGFMSGRDFDKLSEDEKKYYFKLKYKKKMLKQSGLNYKIIYPKDFKKPLDEIFSFLRNTLN